MRGRSRSLDAAWRVRASRRHVRVERRALAELAPPAAARVGLLATNPPWGERLSERSELPALYETLAAAVRPALVGWRLAVVSPDTALEAGLGMKARERRTLGTGKGAATVSVFVVSTAGEEVAAAPSPSARRAPEVVARSRVSCRARTAVAGAEEFTNRLTKMARHYGKWARRAGVSCYRVYDADLPDFSVAIDLYEGAGPEQGTRWAHVAEYAPPAHVDAAKAHARLEAVRAIAPEVLGVQPDRVFVKQRERQRGTAQYERQSKRSVTATVSENGLLFEVNLSDYLDTGLFLDHRDTRAWLRELAPGTRFLNLFAYTGSATVYAAAGGCSASTTVDLSATYLAWAQRNLAAQRARRGRSRVRARRLLRLAGAGR